MKQYYEAEVLFQLMERDGFNIPSSVPPYESEIKAYLINQVKQAYPKLTDYEAEWLLYNYTKHLPAEFPISSVTNATSVTFENVVPFAYQSAILNGQTLVNLFESPITSEFVTIEVSNTSSNQLNLGQTNLLKPNTAYSFIYILKDVKGSIEPVLNLMSGTANPDIKLTINNGYNVKTFTTPSDYNGTGYTFRLYYKRGTDGESNSAMIANTILLEGDYTGIQIPFFTGMQSVKMPVLTTTGKNLVDKNSVIMDYVVFSDGTLNASNGNGVTDFIKVSKGKTYVKNGVNSTLAVYSPSKTFIKRVSSTNTYTSSDEGYIRWNISAIRDVIDTLQIEEGSAVTSYEPFKSNILTVKEDVTLRGVGDTHDELDCLTGEVIERIGEIVLDGSEDWTLQTQNNWQRYMLTIEDMINIYDFKNPNRTHCDKLVYDVFDTKNSGSYLRIYNQIGIYNNEIVKDVKQFKQWLSQNPITLQYQLATESIKTVDLTTVNESGESVHFMPLEGTMNVQSSAESIQPTFDMSVPVEATTQNLASFIDLEMEE